jgi:catechol 2,3-dioxygenase-like lactoylglutathione lyase family enzyme
LCERRKLDKIALGSAAMIAQRLHHTSFPVRDLDRSVEFYRDTLGLEPIARPDLGVPGAWFRAGACEVHLIARFEGVDLGGPPPVLNPMGCHTAFAIEDYEETVAKLKERGLEILEAGREIGQLWVRDPDGHIIELIAADRRPR